MKATVTVDESEIMINYKVERSSRKGRCLFVPFKGTINVNLRALRYVHIARMSKQAAGQTNNDRFSPPAHLLRNCNASSQ